jgi:hypothetical protein
MMTLQMIKTLLEFTEGHSPFTAIRREGPGGEEEVGLGREREARVFRFRLIQRRFDSACRVES